MSGIPQRTALVTGASTGIGYELSKLLAGDGYDLILVARGRAALERLAAEMRRDHGSAVRVLPADLARPGAVEEIAGTVDREGLAVDILVNNAGFADSGPFVESNVETMLGMLQVNVLALTHLTRLILPGMVARHSGKILNVASTAAFQPGPFMAVYFASKAYVLSFSEAIADELRGSGVTVTALCPGPTRTNFQQRANITETPIVRSGLVMDAPEVARIGYLGLLSGRRLVIPGLANRLLALSTRLVPMALSAALVRRTHQPG